ncbi:unnamed protein product [Moneuplotes crassus]|uniref:Uncharacterized protein n=1 Tax=Euplotes crassus TaxID=5936 RepID=A0AAD1UBR0_EUPCR|nr:unnamed protein product [Moneuplotes crassus]
MQKEYHLQSSSDSKTSCEHSSKVSSSSKASLSASKTKPEPVDTQENKENIMPPNGSFRKSFLSDISEKSENNSQISKTTPPPYTPSTPPFTPHYNPSISPNPAAHKKSPQKYRVLNLCQNRPKSQNTIQIQTSAHLINPSHQPMQPNTKADSQKNMAGTIQLENTTEEQCRNFKGSQKENDMNDRYLRTRKSHEESRIEDESNERSCRSGRSAQEMMHTPEKELKSDKISKHKRKLNFDIQSENLERAEKQCNEENKNESDVHDSSCNSFSVSRVTDDNKSDSDEEYNINKTLTISPPTLKDYSKGSELERMQKELGIESSSLIDYSSINENDLDENNNLDIQEKYQQISNESLEEEEIEEGDSKHHNLKNYYLKNSYYLSGITEQSVEESEYFTSYDNSNAQCEREKASKRLLISKYSCSDDDQKDSVVFLYNRLQNELDEDAYNSDGNEYPLPLHSLERSEDTTLRENAQQQRYTQNRPFDIDLTDTNLASKRSILESSEKSMLRYKNFRQGSNGILTIDELCDDSRSTPKKEEPAKNQNESSNLTFNTVSIRKSDIDAGSIKNREFLDYSSIRKLEESGSTMRKDSFIPELYESLPARQEVENTSKIYSRSKNESKRKYQEDHEFSKFSDEQRSTLPLHSDSFKKHSYHENLSDPRDGNNKDITSTEKRNQNSNFRVNSPHFPDEIRKSSTNPFVISDSEAASLKYDSTPSRESCQTPCEDFKMIILEYIHEHGKKNASIVLNEILQNLSGHQTSTIKDHNLGHSFDLRQMKSENENLSAQLALSQKENKTLKEKYNFYCERADQLDKVLRDQESKLLHFTIELENATLMEDQLKKEIDTLKSQREEIEKHYKELKLSKGKEAIQIRQLKSDIESKKREIIEASDLIERATSELTEIKKENSALQASTQKLEKEKFNSNMLCKKLERDIYKVTSEKKKLNTVIQMQKASLNELQRDYYNSQERAEHCASKRTFDNEIYSYNQNVDEESTVVFNSSCKNERKTRKPIRDKVMHSLDNISSLKKFQTRVSPSPSTRTLNKMQSKERNSFTDSIESNLTLQNNIGIHNVESQKAVKENTMNISETEFFYPEETLSIGVKSTRNHAKNLSCTSNTFQQIISKPSGKSPEARTTTKKSKFRILQKDCSRKITRAKDILLYSTSQALGYNSTSEKSPKKERSVIQAPPRMKAVSNFKTMREGHLAKSSSSKKSLLSFKIKKISNKKTSKLQRVKYTEFKLNLGQ